jgi:serine/threonine-protein kinase
MDIPKIPYYHIDRLIAEGGTAKVYWGIDLRSGFPVAIKELKMKYLKNETIKQHFIEETQMYLYLSHPNITKLVDFVDLDGQLFIVMEFIDGRTLDEYINKEIGPIPEATALPMFFNILDTVAYLHNNGFLHLDIKSNNIMLKPDRSIKLLDMGISTKIKDASDSTTGFGTPAYMPPEQINKRALGVYTDIFALGILLFEMLTGKLPFWAPTREEIKQKIQNEPVPKLQRFYPPISPALQTIVEHALAKNPADRYQSCETLKKDIQEIIKKWNRK